MTVFEKIQEQIKLAMRANDAVTRECLRSLVADIKNQSINAGKQLTEEVVMKCIQKAVKQREDSIEQFQIAGRQDLIDKESKEYAILKAYLPQMLSEDETKTVLENILQTIEATKKNFGVIMKQLPKDVDKKLASKLLNGLLK